MYLSNPLDRGLAKPGGRHRLFGSHPLVLSLRPVWATMAGSREPAARIACEVAAAEGAAPAATVVGFVIRAAREEDTQD